MTTVYDEADKVRRYLNQQLTVTGERERLKDLLRSRLLECGWRDELKNHCKDMIAKHGPMYVTANDLVQELTPLARRLIPDSVKQELVEAIRKFLPKENGDENSSG